MLKVVVLDGRDVPNPEDLAMLMALYSRSPKPVEAHLKQIAKRGSSAFHEVFYVGYGHRSIGDCGSTGIFIENISMLGAKAVQDWPLYNGQEVSTRYLDMAKQPIENPLGTPEGQAVQDGWMALYTRVLTDLVPTLKARFPFDQERDKDEQKWEKAINAKAFDIARGLLPAGVNTSVGWHTNLRQAYDHLREMRSHPLIEIRRIASEVLAKLKERYPSSFGQDEQAQKRNREAWDAEEHYLARSMATFAFFDADIREFNYTHEFDLGGLKRYQGLLAARPPRMELHQRLRQFGTITFEFPLDFGSYRDLQRQRSIVQEMPLLSTNYGFFSWYLENMPDYAAGEIEKQQKMLDQLGADYMTKQYYTPMGFTVPVRITCPLPAAVYVAELRSGQTVHPTLRAVAQRMGDTLKTVVPGLAMHHDTSPSEWSVRRGGQDIVLKATV